MTKKKVPTTQSTQQFTSPTQMTTEQRNTHIYNLFKITASTNVTEKNNNNANISY